MVKSDFSNNVMLSFACIFLFVNYLLCTGSFCVATLIIVALSLFQQIFGAPQLDNFRFFSASWLRIHSSNVCFRVAMLYRNKYTYIKRNQMLLIDPYSAASNKIFPTYCRPTVFV